MATILVIDDEELARFTIQEILESEGHVVLEAANGEEGLAVFRDNKVDLVITDIIMPRKEGIETISELKADAPNLPVIAISGGGRTRNLDFLELSKEYGATSVVVKPFTDEDLMAVVNELL
ncbi:response regulator [Magnetospira sp. QH-2]|uniref:response regulator n=1 Tax=Magnetospira sp. (strain QH-2) TaxID=1288970 RepID=UPI0003E80D60|nr:response regulator [Magnetospira sp. QH-2]CCQ72428.1 Response regulator, CheY-like receiver [Magnetospira sp. QH-2]